MQLTLALATSLALAGTAAATNHASTDGYGYGGEQDSYEVTKTHHESNKGTYGQGWEKSAHPEKKVHGQESWSQDSYGTEHKKWEEHKPAHQPEVNAHEPKHWESQPQTWSSSHWQPEPQATPWPEAKPEKHDKCGECATPVDKHDPWPTAAVGHEVPAEGKKVHVVKVSDNNAGLFFEPNSLQAAVGDYVQFQFWPKNHSVVQSTFDNPCVPINEIMPEVEGFKSGFMPVSEPNPAQRPVFTIPVKDEKPIWYYCSQGKHCQGGMGGVINPPASGEKTIEKYIELAKGSSGSTGYYGTGNSTWSSYNSSTTGIISPPGPSSGFGGSSSTTTDSSLPAQQTVSSAPGQALDAIKMALVGIAAAGAAFVLL